MKIFKTVKKYNSTTAGIETRWLIENKTCIGMIRFKHKEIIPCWGYYNNNTLKQISKELNFNLNEN